MNIEGQNSDKKLNIELTNLDELTKKTLSYFFSSNLCQYGKLSQSQAKTNLYIVDSHRKSDNINLSNLENSAQYAIVLHIDSEKPHTNNNVFYLKKPIDTFKLKSLVEHIYKKVYKNIIVTEVTPKENVIIDDSQHSHLFNAINVETQEDIHLRSRAQKYVGSNKDIDIEDIDKHKGKIFLTETKYIYYYLKKAKKMAKTNKSNVIMKTFSGDVYYDFNKNIFMHNLEVNKVKLLQSSPIITEIKYYFIDDDSHQKSTYVKSIDATEFIWESAIQASKGRVTENTDITKCVNMKTWPNFSKLQIFRYAVQISAVWSRHKLSLVETAKQLSIPQRYVFTLFFAMNSLGYAHIENKTERNENNSVLDKNKNSSVFSKMLSHIFR